MHPIHDQQKMMQEQAVVDASNPPLNPRQVEQKPGEINGPKGLEPTRFGDWEVNGRCSDF